MNWTPIARTLNELLPNEWAALLVFLGALYSLGNDQPNLLQKLRHVLYGALFGYFLARPCIEWMPDGWRSFGYLIGGATSLLIVDILMGALRLARADPGRLFVFIWEELKTAIPLSDLLTKLAKLKKQP